MSVLHYIDNEVPDFGEWDSVVESGACSIVQTAEASFPERGAVGLRCTTSAGAVAAYVAKTGMAIPVAAGASVFLGAWVRMGSAPAGSTNVIDLRTSLSVPARLYLNASGQLDFTLWDDASVWHSSGNSGPLVADRWHWLVLELVRASSAVASDGAGRIYLDGVQIDSVTGIDNYDSADELDGVRLGATSSVDPDMVLDLDEVKIADAYPEPYVPDPPGETLSPERVVVLWNGNSADSRAFADYCVSELGVPRANLIRLDGAAASESLPDHAACAAQIETPIADYFALNPTVAANCMCFLVGYGVPGCFTSGGVSHSVTSRLMHYGSAFLTRTCNPLYAPATVARLTKADLAAAGVYLAVRIDSDTLDHAKAIIDRAAAVSALAALPDADTLYTDQDAFRASVACQRLRIATAALGAGGYDDDAFIWGDAGGPEPGEAGSRACFTDTDAASASTIRSSASPVGAKLIEDGYAAGLGSAGSADGFDVASFFEMLRVGGTIAEAFMVALAHVDYTSVACGWPLMTVAFQRNGYNVYRGVGGVENVDFDAPVACLRAGDTAPELAGLGHDASTEYTYVVRPVRGAAELETPDLSCRVTLRTDAAGEWPGPAPASVESVRASPDAGGQVAVGWEYRTPYGADPPVEFRIYCGPSPVPAGPPAATVDYDGDRSYSATVAQAGGQTCYVAVTARSAAGVESPVGEVAGPMVTDDDPPPTPTVLADATF